MLTLVFALVVAVLIGIALWSSTWGEGKAVLGEGNSFEAYYGKNRNQPGKSPPCADCERMGCIGAGECRCPCHRDVAKAA